MKHWAGSYIWIKGSLNKKQMEDFLLCNTALALARLGVSNKVTAESISRWIPDTCRNSPVLWPYRLTECSKAFLSVEPFSCTRSKVPPKGKTEIRSSMVIEPTDDTSAVLSKRKQQPQRLPFVPSLWGKLLIRVKDRVSQYHFPAKVIWPGVFMTHHSWYVRQ